jgi:hypothetical protein
LSETNEYDLLDIYAEDVDEMDADVTTAVVLQLIAGVLVLPNLIIILIGGFPVFSMYPTPNSFFMTFVNVVYTSILVFLVPASIYLAWALWYIKPRARFNAIVVNIVSFIVHILNLGTVIAFNLILIFYLRTRRMKEIFIEATPEEVALY